MALMRFDRFRGGDPFRAQVNVAARNEPFVRPHDKQ